MVVLMAFGFIAAARFAAVLRRLWTATVTPAFQLAISSLVPHQESDAGDSRRAGSLR